MRNTKETITPNQSIQRLAFCRYPQYRSHLLERCPLSSSSFPFNVDLQDASAQKKLRQCNIGERGATLGREEMADTCCTFLTETNHVRYQGNIRELKQRTFLRSRTPTGSRWSNHVHTAHVMTFVWSRRRRQNATFQVEGRTPQNML